jgi:hypothetical protein
MQDKRLWMGIGLTHGGSSLGLADGIDAPANDGLIPKPPSTPLCDRSVDYPLLAPETLRAMAGLVEISLRLSL